MTIIRYNNTIITDWFNKPTSFGRLINFRSNHPKQQKINIIYATLLFLCSMIVDEHITLFPLFSDCRPDNLKIKRKRRCLLQAG